MTATDLIGLFVDTLIEDGRTDATIDAYTKTLARADRELPSGLKLANAEELRAWVYRRHLARSSSATYHAALDSFFSWGVATNRSTFNPMDHVKRPRVPEGLPRVATDEQAYWAIHETPDPLKLWAILALFAALRCIEISRLCREHVTDELIAVHLGKGNRPRMVPTHPTVWAMIRDLPAGPITDLTPKQISTKFLQYALRCGLREFSLHRLRGLHATLTYERSKDLLAVQRNLGHSKPERTARYIRITTDQRRAVIEGLPTWDAAAPRWDS